MSNIWFTADQHFNHGNIIHLEGRPFVDKDEMNEVMIQNWNNVVKKDDTVYHLGDVVFGGAKIKEGILKRLNGYKVLRIGNHDEKATKTNWLKYFDEVYDEDILLDGDFCLSHYPLDDITSLKLINNGLIKGNIHGHTHGLPVGLDPKRYFCVSVEMTGYTPVPYNTIKKHFGIPIAGEV